MRCHPYPDLMDFEEHLSADQKLVMSSARSYFSDAVKENVRRCYLEEKIPQTCIRDFGARGFLGPFIQGYDLPGIDSIAYGLLMREIERVDSGLRSFASVQGALVMYPIFTYGSDAQKEKWLRKLGRGEAVGCFGLTESQGGSDPSAMQTKATSRNGKWILSGSKMWITNGCLADVAVVWARKDSGEIGGFLLEKGMKGFSTKTMRGKLSLRASITSELYFDNVELPAENELPLAKGMKAPLSCLTQARYGISWGALGAAEACFDEVVRYTKDRVLFGGPLAGKQLVQNKLAHIANEITKAQLLALHLGQLKNSGRMDFAQVSLAKMNNVKMALDVARTCRDILGANGIMIEYDTMRHMTNLETVFTYEGTHDIHALIVGQKITGIAAF